jgi:hypothetical protein
MLRGFQPRTIREIADAWGRSTADVVAVIEARRIPAIHSVEGVYFFAILDVRQIEADLAAWPPGQPFPSPLPAPRPLPFKTSASAKPWPKDLLRRVHAPLRAACERRVEEARRRGQPLTNF